MRKESSDSFLFSSRGGLPLNSDECYDEVTNRKQELIGTTTEWRGTGVAEWQKIKTEYITTDTSYRRLAEKYGVHYQTICARSKAEGWIELREQYRNKTLTKTVEKISEKKAGQAAKVGDLANKLLMKLEKAIDELDLKVTSHKVKTEIGATETTTEFRVAEPGGTVDRNGLRQLTGALRELQAIKGEITDLERREREARIQLLRNQADKDSDKEKTVTVVLEGDLSKYAK